MRLNVVLLVLFAVTLGLHVRFQAEPSRPNVEFFPNMARSPAFESFSENPNFPDGKTLQLPPAHVVPRGAIPAAGPAPENPVSRDDLESYTRGAAVYRSYCLPCHGPAGRGDGAVAMRGFPAPPPLNSENALKMTDAKMFQIVSAGQKNMPSYAAQIPEPDRWKVILYVRALQEKMK
jgi:mono/diheme cytochrome c family protein